MTLTGHGTNDIVDVGLGYGNTSTTTIAGTLTMGSTASMTNAGLLSVAGQTNITSLGTLTNLQVDDVNINTKSIEILGDTGDTFNITTGAAGATTMTTVDAGGAAGHLGLVADGNITMSYPSEAYVNLINSGSGISHSFTSETGAESWFSMYPGGDVSDDFFQIEVQQHGHTTLRTRDADNSYADFVIEADGEIQMTSTENKIKQIFDFHDSGSGGFETTYSDDQASGTILRYSPGADESPAGSELFFLHTDGTWDSARATVVANGASQLLGVGLGGSARTTGVLLKGFVRIASTEILNVPGSGAVDGLPVYVSTTSGHFDFTAPSSSNNFVRIVGYAIDDDSGDVLIYFDPDKTWVEIA